MPEGKEVDLVVLANIKTIKHLLNVMETACFLNCIKMPNKLFGKSGPDSRTLFNDTSLNSTDESNPNYPMSL